MLDDEEGAEEKGETGFSPSNSCKHREPRDVPRPTTNPLVDSSTLLAPFALSSTDGAHASSPFSVVRDPPAPRYTGLLQVGRVVDSFLPAGSWNHARNGKRDEFNLILYACLMKPMPGDDFMPFQLGGSRFDRPKVVDFGRRRNLEKPSSLSLSLFAPRFGCIPMFS